MFCIEVAGLKNLHKKGKERNRITFWITYVCMHDVPSILKISQLHKEIRWEAQAQWVVTKGKHMYYIFGVGFFLFSFFFFLLFIWEGEGVGAVWNQRESNTKHNLAHCEQPRPTIEKAIGESEEKLKLYFMQISRAIE